MCISPLPSPSSSGVSSEVVRFSALPFTASFKDWSPEATCVVLTLPPRPVKSAVVMLGEADTSSAYAKAVLSRLNQWRAVNMRSASVRRSQVVEAPAVVSAEPKPQTQGEPVATGPIPSFAEAECEYQPVYEEFERRLQKAKSEDLERLTKLLNPKPEPTRPVKSRSVVAPSPFEPFFSTMSPVLTAKPHPPGKM